MNSSTNTEIFRSVSLALILISALFLTACSSGGEVAPRYEKVATFAGIPNAEGGAQIKEPYGLAINAAGELFISDGEDGKIWKADKAGALTLVTAKLHTPSAIAFDKNGTLYVADTGSHTIKKIDVIKDEVEVIAGVENRSGFSDGDAKSAMFNGPIGIAIDEVGRIYIADTYNDRIRVIDNGRVSTLAGSEQGFADADTGAQAKFDTPCAVTIGEGGVVLVADTGNRRIRSIDNAGKVSTVAGGGTLYGTTLPLLAAFTEPVDVKVDKHRTIFVADASENNIYSIGPKVFPLAEKMVNGARGIADGNVSESKFNRPTGIAVGVDGNLFVADSENQLVRVMQTRAGSAGSEIKPEQIISMRPTAQAFRAAAPARWPYDPPQNKREIAGTLGEVRGEIAEGEDTWFHNGLDVVGGYGETARFVRAEKVLRPMSAQLFNTLRENLRMPTLGYIHIRLGRDQTDNPFDDPRFLFSYAGGKMKGIRIRRGAKFEAGDPIGTLNSMNHVHLIAGRAGHEMNAVAALELPGIGDSIAPVIENVKFYDENWSPVAETQNPNSRINIKGKVRVVAKAYDRMDGNAERRRLGVFSVGYQLLNENGSPVASFEEPKATISFDKLPDDGNRAVRFVYAPGSKSGATGETIFNYTVSNNVQNGSAAEGFFESSKFAPGNYTLKVFARDYFGNEAVKELKITISQ